MSMGRRQKETESPKEYPGSARSDEMPLHYKREVVHLHPVRRHLPDPTCSSLQAMLEAQLPLCPGFPVCHILLSGRFSLWLCQFYSHTAATVEAEDASSSHSQDSGQVHKVISRVRAKHVSWPQGYQGVREGARLEWGGKLKSNYNPEPFGSFLSFFFPLTKLEGFRRVFFCVFQS